MGWIVASSILGWLGVAAAFGLFDSNDSSRDDDDNGADGDGDILTASARGFGKRTPVVEYPKKGRGTQGVLAIKTSDRNGKLVGAVQLSEHHDVLLISDGGTLVRTPASAIAQVGRNTQGVTLMRLAADETLQAIERLDASLEAGEGALAESLAGAVQLASPMPDPG